MQLLIPRTCGAAILLSGLGVLGCSNKDGDPYGASDGTPPVATVDTTDSDDTDGGDGGDSGGGGDSDSDGGDGGDSDTGGESPFEQDYQDEPGDVIGFNDAAESIDLSDVSGDSNRAQEFYGVFINVGEAEGGFQLNYAETLASDGGSATSGGTYGSFDHLDGLSGRFAQGASTSLGGSFSEALTSGALGAGVAEGARRPFVPADPPPPPTVLTDADIGSASESFYMINDLDNQDRCNPVTVKLWALGDYVTIWVDEDVPIDWDYECDGVIDEWYDDVGQEETSFGFDNCDLDQVADIVDHNIIVNFQDMFGYESDINEDGKISVVISPQVNHLTADPEDEDDQGEIIGSYADPDVDLADFTEENSCSDEQEVIYVFAPDPNGFYNPYATPTIEEYTSQALVGEIARSYLKLISFNQHVIERAGDPEEAWLTEVLADVGTDIVGFGAILYDDAWRYMSAPHLYALTARDDDPITLDNRGPQYLFGRWLVDNFGTGVLSGLIQTKEMGVANIELATGQTFDDLVQQWQVAMLVSGVSNDAGDPLVDDSVWPQYTPASTISAPDAPPSSPSPGTYYGANGYQTGFNVHGTNYYIEGGTTTSPSEITFRRVVVDGPDAPLYVPGTHLFGYTAGSYGASVVRFSDLDYLTTTIELETSGNYIGAYVRWNDPTTSDHVLENVFGATDARSIEMPALPDDGTQIIGIGTIDPDDVIISIDVNEDQNLAEVSDTDRYTLDLSDRDEEPIQVAVWLQRMYGDIAGAVDLYNPRVAIPHTPARRSQGPQRSAAGPCVAPRVALDPAGKAR